MFWFILCFMVGDVRGWGSFLHDVYVCYESASRFCFYVCKVWVLHALGREKVLPLRRGMTTGEQERGRLDY